MPLLFTLGILLILFPGSVFSQVDSWSVELANTLIERYANPWDFGDSGCSYFHGHMLEGSDIVRRNGGIAVNLHDVQKIDQKSRAKWYKTSGLELDETHR